MKRYFCISLLIFGLFLSSSVYVYAQMRFPTLEGQNFTWWTGYSSLWHSTTWDQSAIDIGANGGEMNVIASEAGIIILIKKCDKSGYVKIAHQNGVHMEYWHLDAKTMELGINSRDKSVKQGQYLGKLWKGNLEDMDCGYAYQAVGSGHLHWVMTRNPITIDGFLFDEPNMFAYKNNQYLYGGSVFPSTNSMVLMNGTVTGFKSIYKQTKLIRSPQRIMLLGEENGLTISSSDGDVFLQVY